MWELGVAAVRVTQLWTRQWQLRLALSGDRQWPNSRWRKLSVLTTVGVFDGDEFGGAPVVRCLSKYLEGGVTVVWGARVARGQVGPCREGPCREAWAARVARVARV